MKLRIPRHLHARIIHVGEIMNMNNGEVIRRCLRQYRKANVAIPINLKSATHVESVPIEVDLWELNKGMSGKEVCAAVEWCLNQPRNRIKQRKLYIDAKELEVVKHVE